MNIKRFNWATWSGFLLSLFAFLSYYLIFVWFEVTRDFPWANLLLFAAAVVLLILGVRKGFSRDRSTLSKILTSLATVLGLAVCALFLLAYFVMGRQIPASPNAPHVGQKAPEFSIPDTNNKPVTLDELLSTPVAGRAPKGVLLIFYRGYW
jgi:drug/metabolite transporter (DMT)-like permease